MEQARQLCPYLLCVTVELNYSNLGNLKNWPHCFVFLVYESAPRGTNEESLHPSRSKRSLVIFIVQRMMNKDKVRTQGGQTVSSDLSNR